MNLAPPSSVFSNVEWPDRPWFRSNILLDHSGSPSGVDGTSRSLTRGRDRELLRALRQDAQAIVTGGETVRAEGWHFPPDGFLFVASQGFLPLGSCPRTQDLKVFRFVKKNPASLTSALKELTSVCAVRHLLSESGPTLLREMVTAELIDEAFVSIADVAESTKANQIDAERIARHRLELNPEVYQLSEFVRDIDLTYLRFIRRAPAASPVFFSS